MFVGKEINDRFHVAGKNDGVGRISSQRPSITPPSKGGSLKVFPGTLRISEMQVRQEHPGFRKRYKERQPKNFRVQLPAFGRI